MDFTSGIIFDRNDSRENRILELAPSGVKQSESQRKRKMKLALPIQDSRRFAQIVPDGQMPRLAAEEARMSSERSMTGADLTTPKTSDQRASEEGLEDLPDMSAQTIDGVEALYDDDQEL
ncbi:hypothetical protein Tdes44962_MAKER02389 [Teratosphaeria destructans]|uniref:Uncharacterized protein n=1 Tax=Teratosphaeria destructans TaxID=418781 RepID=A0A9W7W383_9PEZI|nr:hypothetical protein Tdes44962_MAKER02389 [Teratosphaeria destructans]